MKNGRHLDVLLVILEFLYWTLLSPNRAFPAPFSSSSQVLVACEGLTLARLMGHLAKYNLKPPLHGHAQALHCAASVNTRSSLTFFPAARTQSSGLIYTLLALDSQHAINISTEPALFAHSARLGCTPVCYSCPSSKANHGEPSRFNNARDGGQEFLRAWKVADSEDIMNRVNSAPLGME